MSYKKLFQIIKINRMMFGNIFLIWIVLLHSYIHAINKKQNEIETKN